MGKILKTVVEIDETIASASDNYFDDIIVNENVVSTETVSNLFWRRSAPVPLYLRWLVTYL